MQRMADLEPCIAWTAHGQPIDDVHRTVRQKIHFYERRAHQIVELIGAEERTAYEIAGLLFGPRDRLEAFLALSQTIGHLDWLEEQGRVAEVSREGAIYWRRK
jgi:hypothetical protein